MADNGMLKIGLIGGAAFLAYKQGWLSMFGLGGMPSDAVYIGDTAAGQVCPGTGTPVSVKSFTFHSASTGKYYCTTTPPTAAQVAAAQAAQAALYGGSVQAGPVTTPRDSLPPTVLPSLDALGAQIVARVGSGSAGPDEFNSLLTQIYPAAGPLPDPNQLFAGSGWSRPQTMGFSTYWTATAPWLKANKGLSGFGSYGLGLIGELAAEGRF
jgi:hypothetical protein